ncbi:MAG TPA: cupredoxin domain-containing protein [Candidatus Saccharimonadaceae bacterium]|jgi:plastocyanin|nr:cupredoxin domain-containing protein [Candidatus Saccharimonadaceae bacterium]
MRSIRFAAALALIGIASCTPGLKKPVVSVDAKPDANGVQRVEVAMHTYWFEPNRIVVHAGHPVELEFKNHSWFAPHNCTVIDPDVAFSRSLGPQGHHVERLNPTKPGEYEFFCHVDSHAKKGMKGTLVVLP